MMPHGFLRSLLKILEVLHFIKNFILLIFYESQLPEYKDMHYIYFFERIGSLMSISFVFSCNFLICFVEIVFILSYIAHNTFVGSIFLLWTY
ncbi:hypothetical protein ASE51_24435 [Bacillus sp. Root147]|nr:hypothetical protein ASE51_24435 [Bacillus sp. Root147]